MRLLARYREAEGMAAVIEVQHLHKRYGDTLAVGDVSFTVHEGEIFGILGPNGAGKTTTVECVEGLRAPDQGTISVLGLDPQRDRTELTQLLGVQLQESRLPDQLQVAVGAQLVRGAAGENVLIRSALLPRLPTAVDDIDLIAITPRQRQRVQRPVLVDAGHPALLACAVHGRSLGTGSAA